MFGISTSEKLDELGQIMVKQLKNRYGDPSTNRRFVVGVDRSRMRLYDVEQSAQDDIMEDRPVMDNGHFMTEDTERNKPRQKFTKDVFAGFK